MTIQQALNTATKKLSKSSTSPALDAEMLLAFCLKQTRTYILVHMDKNVTPTVAKRYNKLVNLRANGWPVAYLTGHREFFGLDLIVNKHVLIPRPWTEALVYDSIRTLQKYSGLNILDVGTGSGAIIIALAKTLGKKNKYFASDISQEALAVAKKNAKKFNVSITFKNSDLLEKWGKEFDVVTANLPYLVKETNISTKHEPKLALLSKNNGLEHYENLINQLSKWKKHPKFLFIESEPHQKNKLKQLIKKSLPKTYFKITSDSSAFNINS